MTVEPGKLTTPKTEVRMLRSIVGECAILSARLRLKGHVEAARTADAAAHELAQAVIELKALPSGEEGR